VQGVAELQVAVAPEDDELGSKHDNETAGDPEQVFDQTVHPVSGGQADNGATIANWQVGVMT